MVAERQEDSRAGQRRRTRAALIAAAQELSAGGATPTVAEAAARAGVSRATAYRYFPTQDALLVEVSDVTPGVEPVEELLRDLAAAPAGPASPAQVEERLLALLDTFGPIAVAREEQLRTALMVYQDTWLRARRGGEDSPAVREGRRMRWLDTVLEPLSLDDERRRRLRAALALTVGMDSLVVMKDVARLDDDEALQTLRWAAQALLRAALEEQPRR